MCGESEAGRSEKVSKWSSDGNQWTCRNTDPAGRIAKTRRLASRDVRRGFFFGPNSAPFRDHQKCVTGLVLPM